MAERVVAGRVRVVHDLVSIYPWGRAHESQVVLVSYKQREVMQSS